MPYLITDPNISFLKRQLPAPALLMWCDAFNEAQAAGNDHNTSIKAAWEVVGDQWERPAGKPMYQRKQKFGINFTLSATDVEHFKRSQAQVTEAALRSIGKDDPGPSDVHVPGVIWKKPKKPKSDEVTKAAAKTLYVNRSLLNGDDIKAWAASQGIYSIIGDLHVTIAFSKTPVDWGTFEPDERELTIDDGAREIHQFPARTTPNGAMVLLFQAPALKNRWDEFRAGGASWDFPEYKSHLTITYSVPDADVASIEPYSGPLIFGPEEFAEVNDGWANEIVEEPTGAEGDDMEKYNPNHAPAGTPEGGQFTSGDRVVANEAASIHGGTYATASSRKPLAGTVVSSLPGNVHEVKFDSHSATELFHSDDLLPEADSKAIDSFVNNHLDPTKPSSQGAKVWEALMARIKPQHLDAQEIRDLNWVDQTGVTQTMNRIYGVKRRISKAGARHSRSDVAMLQQMHDNAVKLGASCSDEVGKREGWDGTVEAQVLKLDEEQHMVYGWASVVTHKGELIIDHQGDIITPDEIEKASTDFMKDVRTHGDMHQKAWVMKGDDLIQDIVDVGAVVHSFPLTNQLMKALGIHSDNEGWIVGVFVRDPITWSKYKDGTYKGFSIGGRSQFEASAELLAS